MLEKLSVEDRRVFKEMVEDEMFYIDTEFAHASGTALNEAIKDSVAELIRGFPSLTNAEIKAYMIGKWGSRPMEKQRGQYAV
jgi:hypothetical protein